MIESPSLIDSFTLLWMIGNVSAPHRLPFFWILACPFLLDSELAFTIINVPFSQTRFDFLFVTLRVGFLIGSVFVFVSFIVPLRPCQDLSLMLFVILFRHYDLLHSSLNKSEIAVR